MYWLLALLLLLAGPAPVPAAGTPYSAVVLDLEGKVTATRNGETRSLELGAMLYPQEVVETGAGASLTLYYPESGEEEHWPGGLKFTVGTAHSDPLLPQVRRQKRPPVELPALDSPPGGLKVRGQSSDQPGPPPSPGK